MDIMTVNGFPKHWDSGQFFIMQLKGSISVMYFLYTVSACSISGSHARPSLNHLISEDCNISPCV
jgi:hypothetical protein